MTYVGKVYTIYRKIFSIIIFLEKSIKYKTLKTKTNVAFKKQCFLLVF